jgi:hypothetical protein
MRNMLTGGITLFVGGIMALICLLLPSPDKETALWRGGIACALMFGIILVLTGLIFLTYGIIESTTMAAERRQLIEGGARFNEEDEEDEDEDDED